MVVLEADDGAHGAGACLKTVSDGETASAWRFQAALGSGDVAQAAKLAADNGAYPVEIKLLIAIEAVTQGDTALAAKWLARRSDLTENSIPPLIERFDDESDLVRYRAVCALAKIKSPKIIAPLSKLLKES